MDMHFWHRKWETNEIAFHERQANPHLVKYVSALALAPGSRVFLPLCGKTRDIAWLLAQGYRVAGVELSKLAVDQLFAELEVVPEVTQHGTLQHYRAARLDVFVGDMFAMTPALLGPVDAVYDRAALVALPQEMRPRYAALLAALTDRAPQLLISYEYDQSLLPGPPFSIGAGEVAELYLGTLDYRATLLGSAEVAGGLKGKIPSRESIWLLQPMLG